LRKCVGRVDVRREESTYFKYVMFMYKIKVDTISYSDVHISMKELCYE